MAVSGSFRPWPVRVQTIRSPFLNTPRSAAFLTPATDAAEAGSQKIPLGGGDDSVGLEDLLVGDHIDESPGFVPGLLRPLPRRRVADADGGGDGLGVRHHLPPSRSGAAPRRLEADHLGRAGWRRLSLKYSVYPIQ